MTVQVNRGCCLGSLLDGEAMRTKAPRAIGPASVNHVVRECVQLLINSAVQPKTAFYKVDADTTASRILNVTG